MIFVTIGGSNLVREVFDSENNNVPGGATPITDAEFHSLSHDGYVFSDYRIIGGALQLTVGASQRLNDRTINNFGPQMVGAFLDLFVAEINILRGEHHLPLRTVDELKDEMADSL